MNKKTYLYVVGSLFAIITFVHVLRLVFGWQANIGGWDVPMWLSNVFVIVAGFMTYTGLKFGRITS